MSRCLAAVAGATVVLTGLGSGGLVLSGPAGATVSGSMVSRTAGPAATAAAPLRVATRSLPPAVRGLSYLTALAAAGGTEPYTWSATALPGGLRLTAGGLLSGYPAARGTKTVPVRVRDAAGHTARATLRLAVQSTLPGGCVARACALLSPSPRTVVVPAAAVVTVTGKAAAGQAAPGQAGQVLLHGGPPVTAGDLLTVAATAHDPSGLLAVAESVSDGRGATAVTVRSVTPASVFDAGTVQAGTVTTGAAGANVADAPAAGGALPAPAASAAGAGVLSCTSRVTSHVHGLTVTPALTPAVALQWRRGAGQRPAASPDKPGPAARGARVLNPGGAAAAGLRLFQFSLAGTVTVNLGVSVSGPSHCTMRLPVVRRSVAAGGLGAVALRLSPTLTLVTTGPVDVTTSVTLSCAATYRLLDGQVTRTDYCSAAGQRPGLSGGGSVSATVTGAIGVSAALGGLRLVSGTATTALHAATLRTARTGGGQSSGGQSSGGQSSGGQSSGGQPAGASTRAAEADARTGFDLTAALGDIWAGAARVTVAGGTAFSGVVRPAASAAPPATNTGRPATAAALAMTPAVAYPWSASVCGYPEPTFGKAAVTVAGRGFGTGERVMARAGWRASAGATHAGGGGAFTVTEPVGEVPSVLNRRFAITAKGTAGSAARSTTVLDADGCLRETNGGGRVALRWGGNGFDPGATLTLSVSGKVAGYAAAGTRGSGGATATVTCPAAGRYQWQVSGTVNGAPAAASGWLRCASRSVSPGRLGTSARVETGAPATAQVLRSPWRVPPARPPLA